MATELQTFQTRTAPETRSFVRDGVPGNLEVVYAMIRLTRKSVKDDHCLEALAKDVVGDDSFYTDTQDIFRKVFNFVKSHVKYRPDVAGRIESIKSARVTLSDGWGDCDDQAILNASLLGCLGFEDVRFCIAKYLPTDVTYVHIYAVVYDQGKRYVFDTTLPNGELNKEVKALDAKEFPIFQNVVGLDGISGLYTNARYAARSFAGTVSQAIPAIVATMPLGFTFGNALATGAGLITQSNTTPLSLNAIGSKINEELDAIINDLINSRIAYDLAVSYALQAVAQLSAVDRESYSDRVYETVKSSVAGKLKFVKDFPAYAKDHDIKVIYLDATKMMVAGVGLAAFAAYGIYQTVIKARK